MKQNTNNEYTIQNQMIEVASDSTAQDFKNAVLIVSIIANLTIFTTWVTVLVA